VQHVGRCGLVLRHEHQEPGARIIREALARLWPRSRPTLPHVKASATGPLIAFETLGHPVLTTCRSVFGRFFALPKGESKEISFSYVAPSVVTTIPASREYRLFIQKQPGTSAIPLRVRVEPPEGARVLSVEMDGSAEGADISRPTGDGAVEVRTDLSQDRELVVRYELSD